MQPTPVLQRALRRLRLTTKQAGKDYYKGHGTGAMGRHTKHGGYIVDRAKVRTYVCPDLTGFRVSTPQRNAMYRLILIIIIKLTPFVSKLVERKARTELESGQAHRGLDLIEMWKRYGGAV